MEMKFFYNSSGVFYSKYQGHKTLRIKRKSLLRSYTQQQLIVRQCQCLFMSKDLAPKNMVHCQPLVHQYWMDNAYVPY